MRKQAGITLIELLTVIAIIGILAGITFPVLARSKDSAYRNSDLSNMNQIRTALQLYQADQGAYPPALLGYATSYMGGIPSVGDVVPANQVAGTLYPKRVESLDTFRPALNRPAGQAETQFSAAVWPNAFNAGGDPLANQKYGPSDPVTRTVVDSGGCSVVPAYFYKIDGYDAATVKTPGGDRHELRYTLFWTGYGLPDNPCTQDRGSMNDNPRQLGYSEPPEDTVVTWNSYFRDYQDGVPSRSKRDLVLFLGGSARPFDSREVAEKSWQVKP